MCGKYYYDYESYSLIKTIVDINECEDELDSIDFSPGQNIPVILLNKQKLVLKKLTWGYYLPQSKQRVINARSETLYQKSLFQEDIKKHRCIIPAKGFYAWDAHKHQLSLEMNQSKMIFMAGIYRPHTSEVTIITLPATAQIKSIHPRIPMIIDYQNIKRWLYDENDILKYRSKDLDKIEIVSGLIQQSLFGNDE